MLAKSPTGSGKTLAFAIPIVERLEPKDRTPGALVLVPTRELARQVTDELAPLAQARGLRVAEVYGGVGIDLQARRAANAHVIVATPGRLEDLMARKLVRLDAVKILVLDEADRMLDLGFQPAVDRILSRAAARAADDVLLGHARRCRRQARRALDARPAAGRGRAPDRPDRRRQPPVRRRRA